MEEHKKNYKAMGHPSPHSFITAIGLEYQSMYIPIYLYINIFIHLFIYPSIYLFIIYCLGLSIGGGEATDLCGSEVHLNSLEGQSLKRPS